MLMICYNRLHQNKSLIKELVDLMKAASSILTKFISDNENVMKTIPETQKAKSLQCEIFNSYIKERILGIKWDVVKDKFTFESLMFESEKVPKRTILKIVASIFDPLGFASSFVSKANIFLQESWRIKIVGVQL